MSRRWLSFQRWRHRRRALEAPLQQLIRQPIPRPAASFGDIEFVSLDIETTGLDPGCAEMLSVGWVLIRNGRVDLATAESYLVRPSGDVGNSASVHGLTDTVVQSGVDSMSVLDKIISVLIGRVFLVHHAGLDKALLDRLSMRRYGVPLLIPVVDTLALEHRRRQRRHQFNEKNSLRLSDLREQYRLPRYSAHDSLVDAIATAELLIAMVAHNDGPQKTRLRELCA